MLSPISAIYKFHVYCRGTRNKRITRKDHTTRMNRLSIIPRQMADIPWVPNDGTFPFAGLGLVRRESTVTA